MTRFESFEKAFLQSPITTPAEAEDIAYAFAELERQGEAMSKFMDALEAALPLAERDPKRCWEALIAVKAWLDHWRSHARPVYKWLKGMNETLYSKHGREWEKEWET